MMEMRQNPEKRNMGLLRYENLTKATPFQSAFIRIFLKNTHTDGYPFPREEHP